MPCLFGNRAVADQVTSGCNILQEKKADDLQLDARKRKRLGMNGCMACLNVPTILLLTLTILLCPPARA